MNATFSVQIDTSKVKGLIASACRAGLKNAVGELKEAVKANVKSTGDNLSQRGRIRNGIIGQLRSDTVGEVEATFIGSRLRELGGTVRPVRMKWLAVPQNIEARTLSRHGFGPRAASQPLFFMLNRKKPGQAFLVNKNSPKGHLDIWYLLLKKAVHKEKPYMRPALEASKPAIPGWFATGAKQAWGNP